MNQNWKEKIGEERDHVGLKIPTINEEDENMGESVVLNDKISSNIFSKLKGQMKLKKIEDILTKSENYKKA